MKDFTEKQKKRYLEHAGNACPKCHKCSITGNGIIETDGSEAWRKCECEECGTEFMDIYKLVDVERQGI